MLKNGIYVERRSWTLDEKRQIVEEAFSATGTVSAVARQHGIQSHQIYRWRDAVTASGRGSGFVAVRVGAPNICDALPVPFSTSAATAAEPVEIVVRSGLVIRVPISAGSAFVGQLATMLVGAV